MTLHGLSDDERGVAEIRGGKQTCPMGRAEESPSFHPPITEIALPANSNKISASTWDINDTGPLNHPGAIYPVIKCDSK